MYIRSFKNVVGFLFLSLLVNGNSYAEDSVVDANADKLSRVVKDFCNKKVVFLGEPGHHGGDIAWQIKADLLKRFIIECKFNAVLFESSVYEFYNLQNKMDKKSAIEEDFRDAIGGLYSVAESTKYWIPFLFENAVKGKVSLGGLDYQLASLTAHYEKKQLADDLVKYLDDKIKNKCRIAINDYANWNYKDTTPYNSKVMSDDLLKCSTLIKNSFSKNHSKKDQEIKLIAENVYRFFERFKFVGDSEKIYNSRDLSMYKNFLYYKEKLPKNSKFLIWTATSHAIKNTDQFNDKKRLKPLGYYVNQLMGVDSAVIGISALSGEYARLRQKVQT